jgi:hypothetical protein
MEYLVEKAFEQYNSTLLPGKENEAAQNHRGSIHALLANKFGVTRFFRVGSIDNGTDIRGHSYTDYFAVIPPNRMHRDSWQTLTNIQDALIDRFPHTHNIHLNPPSVIVPFGENARETTSIIPAEFLRKHNECYVYEIPNRSGGWMLATPEAHYDYITLANIKRHYRVKSLIRFLKAWKYKYDVPIYSFYLEMLVSKYAFQIESIYYSRDFNKILRKGFMFAFLTIILAASRVSRNSFSIFKS